MIQRTVSLLLALLLLLGLVPAATASTSEAEKVEPELYRSIAARPEAEYAVIAPTAEPRQTEWEGSVGFR